MVESEGTHTNTRYTLATFGIDTSIRSREGPSKHLSICMSSVSVGLSLACAEKKAVVSCAKCGDASRGASGRSTFGATERRRAEACGGSDRASMSCCGGGDGGGSLEKKREALQKTPFFAAAASSSGASVLLEQLAIQAELRKVKAGTALDDITGKFVVIVDGELKHTEKRVGAKRQSTSTVTPVEDDAMAIRRAGDFFRAAPSPGQGKANKLAGGDLSRIVAVQKSVLLLLAREQLKQALEQAKAETSEVGPLAGILQARPPPPHTCCWLAPDARPFSHSHSALPPSPQL
jgi:hypothetical protein